jgi:hypothetical protein
MSLVKYNKQAIHIAETHTRKTIKIKLQETKKGEQASIDSSHKKAAINLENQVEKQPLALKIQVAINKIE